MCCLSAFIKWKKNVIYFESGKKYTHLDASQQYCHKNMNSKSVFDFSLSTWSSLHHLFEPHGGSRVIVLGTFNPEFNRDLVQVSMHECGPSSETTVSYFVKYYGFPLVYTRISFLSVIIFFIFRYRVYMMINKIFTWYCYTFYIWVFLRLTHLTNVIYGPCSNIVLH